MIIDSHVHLGHLTGFLNYETGAKALLKMMDRLGVDKVVNSNTDSLTLGDFERGYSTDTEAYEMSGGRIVSYYVYNPENVKASLHFMETYDDRRIFKGIKIHPSWHNTFADDEAYRPVFEFARDKKIPVMSHTWTISLTNPIQKFSTPDRFEKYAGEYSDVILILGHAGGRYGGILQAIDLACKYQNVHVDIAGDIYIAKLVERLTGSIGADRILYGSDYPMMDNRIMLGAVLGADIDIEDKKKIIGGNAERIFGLCE